MMELVNSPNASPNEPQKSGHGPADQTAQHPLLTAKEVMAFLRIGRTTLYQLTKSGQLNFYKVGGELRFRQSDLDHYLEAHRGNS